MSGSHSDPATGGIHQTPRVFLAGSVLRDLEIEAVVSEEGKMERRLLKCHDGKLRGDGFSDVCGLSKQKVKSIGSRTESRKSENGKKLDCPAFGLNLEMKKRM